MSAGTTIGTVEIPVINNIERSKGSEWEEINLVDKDSNILLSGERSSESITINFTLVKSLHSSNKDVELQRQDVKSLEDEDYQGNSINYKDVNGNLVVESVDIPESSEIQGIREGSLNGYLI